MVRGTLFITIAVCVAIAGGVLMQGLAPESGSAWATYRSDRIELQYPPGWSATNYTDDVSNEGYSLVFVSDQPMHEPCHVSVNQKDCGNVIDRIRPGGVLVEWSAWAFPGWSYRNAGPATFTVSGEPARVLRLRVTACRGIGAAAHEVVDAGATSAIEGFIFTACYRGRDSQVTQRQLLEILASTRFLQPVQ